MAEQLFAFHPHLMPPPGSRPFDLYNVHDGGTVSLTASGILPGSTYIVDRPLHGWLRKFAISADDFSKVTFKLMLNGSPVKFYENINVELGTTALPADIYVPLPTGSTIWIYATVVAPAAARWRYQGWVYETEYSAY